MPNILALDIGGANIKLANGHDYAASCPFALWKTPEKLAAQIAECLTAAPSAERIVVTMTGELCDCYETKSLGVKHILAATIEAAPRTPVTVYQTTGQFVAAEEAIENYLLAAASNWHALASFAAGYCEGEQGLLIDIGSTTADLIPLVAGKEAAGGRTDPERLLTGELVYTGVERSPVCAIVSHLPWRDASCPVAQEFFATSGDAYLLLGNLSADETDTNTTDGKPFTIAASHSRFARMVCSDSELVSRAEVIAFAEAIREAQLAMLERAFNQVVDAMPAKPQAMVLSGHGEFLARQLLARVHWQGRIVSLTEKLGQKVSRCAPAHALAVLAQQQK
ncbi:MAG: hydantoinase/oxoprolinase family protein [Bythopirellula sp.]|nr:hydantoinase/oxoprolinase family protein [Bythopirellula sp.]